MKTISTAFVQAKKAFGPALKSSVNPHFNSKYADLATCLEAVDDALLANGIALYQETSEDESGVTVETVFLHESGEVLRCGKLHVPASKQDPQGYGSALSYARRYSLMAACGIAAEDDDGNAASKQRPQPAPLPPPAPRQPKTGVMADVMASLPPLDEPTTYYFDELAQVVNDAFERGGAEDAFAVVEEEKLDNEQKLHLSSRLASDVRAALKKLSIERNKKAA